MGNTITRLILITKDEPKTKKEEDQNNTMDIMETDGDDMDEIPSNSGTVVNNPDPDDAVNNDIRAIIDEEEYEEEEHEDHDDRSVLSASSSSSSSSSPSSPPPPLYEQGQKVLARDEDGILYLAFVRRSLYGVRHQEQLDLLSTIGAYNDIHNNSTNDNDNDNSGVGGGDEATTPDADQEQQQQQKHPRWFYFVHYLAWKVNWDRWVPETHLLPITPTYLEWQQRIHTEHRQLQQSFKQQLTSQQKASKQRIDGGAFLKAWKPQLETILQELVVQQAAEGITTAEGKSKTDQKQSKSPQGATTTGNTKRSRRQEQAKPKKKNAAAAANNNNKKKPKLHQHLEQQHKLRVQHHLALPPSSLQSASSSSSSFTSTSGLEQSLSIPVGLKRILVEEWEILNGPFGMIHDLGVVPTSNDKKGVSIAQVLQDYLESKGISSGMAATASTPLTANANAAPIEELRHQEDAGATVPDGRDTAGTATITPYFNPDKTLEDDKKKPNDDVTFMEADKKEEEQESLPPPPPSPSSFSINKAFDTTTKDKKDLDDNNDDEEKKERQRRQKEWTDMAKGICQLFDQALAFRLLYPTEQSQLSVLLDQMAAATTTTETLSSSSFSKNTTSLSSYYGCAHLLRLCCQLPALMTEQYMKSRIKNNDDMEENANDQDEQQQQQQQQQVQQVLIKPILAKVNDLLRFLQKHQNEYFPQRFRKKTPEELKYEQKWIKRYERKRNTTAASKVLAGAGEGAATTNTSTLTATTVATVEEDDGCLC